MKLSMHEKSLFAILLRSRWWISLAVAVVIVLLSGALLPAKLAPYGMVAALPFAVLSVIAAVRQRHKVTPAQAEVLLTAAAASSWPAFSAQLTQAWQAHGYQVRAVKAADHDLVLEGHGQTVLVAARRWKAARLSQDTLRELHQAMGAQGASAACVVTLAEPSEQAQTFAQTHGLEIVHGATLAQLLHAARPGRK